VITSHSLLQHGSQRKVSHHWLDDPVVDLGFAWTSILTSLALGACRGVQYASRGYVKELESCGFQVSMSRKGNPYDNAYAESLVKTLKSEEVSLWEYQSMEDVQERIPYFIEDVYNQKRLHSSLGYRPPCES
jgi:hypothetical protein